MAALGNSAPVLCAPPPCLHTLQTLPAVPLQLDATLVNRVHIYSSNVQHTFDPALTTYKTSLACEWGLSRMPQAAALKGPGSSARAPLH